MRQRLHPLATIASTAALTGLLGNAWGIANAFISCGGPKSYCLGVIAERLSLTLYPNAGGIAIATLAWIAHQHFTTQMAACENEMRIATLDLLQALSNRRAFPT